MIKILASRGTGKTAQLLKEAKSTNSIIVCSNPSGLEYKAKALGIDGLHFVSYEDFFAHYNHNKHYMVDEVDDFLKCYGIAGYNMTIDD